MNSPDPTHAAFDESLMRLSQLVFAVPLHRRASLLQDVLSFRPAGSMKAEFGLG